jgi:DNA modification methylase
MKRNSIGFELEEKYFNICAESLAQLNDSNKQLCLF